MNQQKVTTDLARKEDIDTILELNRLAYGPKDILANRADFAWRHDQNPAGQAIIPVIRDNLGRVVGFIWLVPLRLRIKGQDRLAATGTNLVIHAQHRKTFGYIKLLRRFDQAFEDENIPLHFSFISDEKYLQMRSNSSRATWNIPVLVKPVLSLLTSWRQSAVYEKEPSVKAVAQFDSSFDLFWDQIKDKYPMMAIRDRAFLAWRFAQFSSRQYRTLVAQAGDHILGYTILRCATIRGIKTGLIMDLLVAKGSLAEAAANRLVAEAQAYFYKQGMLLSAGLMAPYTTEYGILRRAGYVRLPDALTPRAFHFAYFVHKSKDEELFFSPQDWFITFADYESF